MRAVWVDEGSDADNAKLRAHGIDTPSFSVRDPRVTLAYLQSAREQPGMTGAGIYAAWNWLPPPYTGQAAGAAFADWLSAELQRIAPGTPGDFPRVCADIETHDVPYILGFLKRWRQHRAHRATDWALEGYQGGLFTPTNTLAIAASGVLVVPGCYTGDMGALDAVDVALDLCRHSFAPGLISMFYDAARLPAAWTGYAFSQRRLP